MAVPKLKQYLPDKWYNRQRAYYNTYINRVGQTVKLVRRTNIETNQYHDILFANVDVVNIKAVINRDQVFDSFLGSPLGIVQDEIILYAYFKLSDKVSAADLIVIESKSSEDVLVRFVYEVTLLKSWNYEQEVLRKYLLTPIRDYRVIMVYTDELLDTNPPDTFGTGVIDLDRLHYDVLANPGKFSITTDELYPVSGSRIATLDEVLNPTVPTENIEDSPYWNKPYPEPNPKFIESLPREVSKITKKKNPFESEIY